MVKVHTRIKRRLQVCSGRGMSASGVVRKRRPKTFLTEERAKAYAAEKGIKDFELEKVKKGLRFQIVSK